MPSPHLPDSQPRKRLVVAITGASGAPYAARLLEQLVAAGVEVLAIRSPSGARTWSEVVGSDFPGSLPAGPGSLQVLPASDVGAGPASGSFRHDGMIVIPCSMKTLAQIAGGIMSGSLALIADALHNLSDMASLAIAYAARRIAPEDRF